MSAFTPQQFVKNWQNTTLGERQSYQLHFIELCNLIGHATPSGTGVDAAGKIFAFEYGLKKDSGAQGFADVFYEGHFAIEYKGAGKYKDLREAYQQLLLYREKLNNPPLLIVCDIQNWEIHTNWPNTEKRVYSFSNADIANRPSIQKTLRDIFEAPERLHPDRNTAQVTTDAAEVFHVIADDMRRENSVSPSLRVERGPGGEVIRDAPPELWTKLKPLARQMRHEPTPAEERLWEVIRNRQVAGAKFRRQHAIDRFIVDFFCAEAKLVIEVDGAVHDYTIEEDAIRQEFLEAQGLHVLRFKNDEVLTQTHQVLEVIEAYLSHPKSLSIHGEGLEQSDSASPSPRVERGLGGEVNKSAAKGLGGAVHDSEVNARLAHFLTKLVFCLFAEDVSLLPTALNSSKGIFADIVERTYREPVRFVRYAEELFRAMAEGGEVMFQKIPYFNGSLFDDVKVEQISIEALGKLVDAAKLNWESVEPAIFGTLFERSLDPNKRSQLGAHYTSREDILLIVEPVLMQPLRREWDAIKAEAAPIRAQLDSAATPKERIQHTSALQTLREKMLNRLREIRVLDPACGSGNFLYVSLQLLMDMEKEIINHDLFVGLTLALPEVHPRQMYGIEINPIAHDLASIVVWIGYIQWRQNNGYATLTHREPILEALKDNIRLMDAVMNPDGTEPDWPEVDVIVGNPPFLGGNKIRAELGNAYVDNLFRLYDGRVPAFADLVCYWYEKARAHIERDKVKRAGLLATNSIRGGVNREVLKRIKETGDIFMAWSDREWVLDGAAVRVSMVGFHAPHLPHPSVASLSMHELEEDSDSPSPRAERGPGGEVNPPMLDGKPVSSINADLTASVDVTQAKKLTENLNIQYEGTKKGAAFDIPHELAQKMLQAINQSGRSNNDVVHPWVNGSDVVRRSSNTWVIDFGVNMPLEEAQLYEMPFAYIDEYVRPNYETSRNRWWLHERSRPEMRTALLPLSRYVCTARVSSYRIFIWLPRTTIPDSATIAFAREDDYFFGVLHSRLHEVWSLRMGTWLGVGNDPRYTPTTTFETFPFPWLPGQEDVNSDAYKAIASAAKQLHEERAAWLNPPSPSAFEIGRGLGGGVKDRTLTNLYNALNVWRGKEKMKVKEAAGDFAPRLADLHDALDKAVCAAYGWPETVLQDDEEILRRLLELNLQRAGG